jgi:predicted amidohydrolase YtcJ
MGGTIKIISVFLLVSLASQQERTAADIILYNGKIVTVDSNFRIYSAVAIKGDIIMATGSDGDIKRLRGKNTKLVNLEGRTVIPGLSDAHAHPESASVSELTQEIPDVHSINELLSWIQTQAKKKKENEWIIHPKLFFTRLKELRQPTLAELDSVAPVNPVFLNGSYGGMVNTAALRISGITEQTSDPGIVRDNITGRLSGMIRSSAFKLLKVPASKQLSEEEKEHALIHMLKEYNELGITSVCSGGGNHATFENYQQFNKNHQLSVRIFQNIILLPGKSADSMVNTINSFSYKTGDGDNKVRIGALKIVLDGGILTGTAYMREPWGKNAMKIFGISDTSYKGIVNYSREDLLKIVKAANDRNWKFTAHCTGSGGVDLLLDVFEEVNRVKPIKPHRFSIIHGNFYTKDAIAKMQQLGVYADMQPAWFYKDADAMQNILGEKIIASFHPYHSLYDAGVMVNGGSDHMVKTDADESINPYNPFLAMWSIITRTTERGSRIVPDEAISRKEALKMYTINNAYASFEEKIKGSIEPGKLADVAVLSDDILDCPAANIKNIRAELTMLGGQIVYSSGKVPMQ